MILKDKKRGIFMENNLPANVENKKLNIFSKSTELKISDFFSRTGKVALGLSGAFAGLIVSAGASALSIPALPTVAMARSNIISSKRH